MNLQDEVARLAHENASLLELNAALKEGNAALKDANTALKDANGALSQLMNALRGGTPCEDKQQEHTSSMVGASEQRPTHALDEDHPQRPLSRKYANFREICCCAIFLATIPPDHGHDVSIAAGPRSTWVISVKTRRALTSVCKAWHGPATEALYADIALRRVGQISALAHTLRSARMIYAAPDPSKFIKRIRLVQCLVRARCADVAKTDVLTVLQHCTRLTAFEYYPCFNEEPLHEYLDNPFQWYYPIWFRDTCEDSPGNALAERCASGLRHLALAQEMDQQGIEFMHHLLERANHLQTLRLGPVSEILDVTSTWFKALPYMEPVILTHLRSLEVHCTLLDLEDYVRSTWEFTNLKEFTVLCCEKVPLNALEQLGHSLQYLHIQPSSEWTNADVRPFLTKLHTLCPALKHIVLPNIPTLDLLSTIASPTLQYLDLWAPAQKQRVIELMCEMGRESSLPALRCIRMLSVFKDLLAVGLSPTAHPHLPLLCNPSAVSGDEVCMRTLPGARVLQTSWAVFLDIGGQEGDPVKFHDDGDTNSESSYVPSDREDKDEGNESDGNEEGGDGRSSQSSESETASEGNSDDTSYGTQDDSEGEAAPEQQWSREELLDRYAKSQEEDFLFDSDDD
ncbi:hypothetical protein BC628DRAFT_1319505 [Trametes gibbosa]|nr:hypothetical protein BC628DRAFT_1319505 [Trametes gibbosa]